MFIANNQKFEASDCDLGPSRLAKPQQHEKPKAAVAVAAGGAVTARSTETQAAARAARRATRGVALASGNKRKTKDTDGDTAAAATHAPQVAGAKQTKKKKKKSKEVQPSTRTGIAAYQTNLSVAQDGTTLAEAKLYELRKGEQGDDGTHLAVLTAVVKIMTAGELDEVTKMICNIIKPCCCGGGGCGGGSWSCSSVKETDRTKMTIDIPENGNCTPLRLAVV